MIRLGILSDTHGLLRPEAEKALQGCQLILHAGDVGKEEILEKLGKTAPVLAVRGNVDPAESPLPENLDTEYAGLRIFMTHRPKDLPKDLTPYQLAVCGHTHRYSLQQSDSQTVLNPGSCGPKRFALPVTLALLETDGTHIHVTRVVLADSGKMPAQRDMRQLVEQVMRETARGADVASIAARCHADPALVEQIARLYVTHPGVTADGILTKMGL